MSSSAAGTRTTDHDVIRRWAEERGAHPAHVKATGDKGGGEGGDDAGILRLDFDDGEPDPGLERVSWEAFFATFEERGLAFLHQDETKDGAESRFNRFVRR